MAKVFSETRGSLTQIRPNFRILILQYHLFVHLGHGLVHGFAFSTCSELALPQKGKKKELLE